MGHEHEAAIHEGTRAMTAEERRERRSPFTGWQGMPPAKHRTEYVDVEGKAHDSQLNAFMASTRFHLIEWIETFISGGKDTKIIASSIMEGREELIAILTPPRVQVDDNARAALLADELGEEIPPEPKPSRNVRLKDYHDDDEDEDDDKPERKYVRSDIIDAFHAGVKYGATIRPFPSKVLK